MRTPDSFKHDARPLLEARQMNELATSRWAASGAGVLLLDPSGKRRAGASIRA
ncbi:hypothetical protein [Azohydromonas australica]|uniref:hypothetical protein n=1 Tax=Azohydromonas australica TaxID=364039 RepID=UPI0035BF0E74